MAGNPNPTMASANAGLTVLQGELLTWTGQVRLVERRLSIPARNKKPSMYFVNSLSDLFHPSLPDAQVLDVFSAMYRAPWHTYQILTKHGETRGRLISMMRMVERELGPVPRNVWLGMSVEDRARKSRIGILREAPAGLRFLSVEPLLEDLGTLPLDSVDWVIVGGESGGKARPCDVTWIRRIVAECRSAGVPVFVKQLGSRPVGAVVKDRKGGAMEEWPEDLRVREMPKFGADDRT